MSKTAANFMLAANLMDNFLDIENREEDFKKIKSETYRAELGIRSIGLIYHDHSADQKSYDNVFRLKENIEYRLFAATHQYLIFLRELGHAELFLQDLYKKNLSYINPNTFPLGNPFFETTETELSSIFDSIIFHLSSVFDYLSHAICYIYFTNKEETLYWTKLSKKVRGDLKGKFNFCITHDEIDRRFVGHLYDYRSRLLHHKRDNHSFVSQMKLHDLSFKLKISCSDTVLKHFSLVSEDNTENKTITLTYLSSWLIKRSFIEIENILDAIKIDLEKDSHFHQNLIKPKDNRGFNLILVNPETNFAEPMSGGLWKEYKGKKGNYI